MAKYARPRSLSGSEPRKLGSLYCSKTLGGHIQSLKVKLHVPVGCDYQKRSPSVPSTANLSINPFISKIIL